VSLREMLSDYWFAFQQILWGRLGDRRYGAVFAKPH